MAGHFLRACGSRTHLGLAGADGIKALAEAASMTADAISFMVVSTNSMLYLISAMSSSSFGSRVVPSCVRASRPNPAGPDTNITRGSP